MDCASLVTLFQGRSNICKKFFGRICIDNDTSHELHHLVPPRYDTGYFLRHNNSLDIPKCETSRFSNSFVIAGSTCCNTINYS